MSSDSTHSSSSAIVVDPGLHLLSQELTVAVRCQVPLRASFHKVSSSMPPPCVLATRTLIGLSELFCLVKIIWNISSVTQSLIFGELKISFVFCDQ